MVDVKVLNIPSYVGMRSEYSARGNKSEEGAEEENDQRRKTGAKSLFMDDKY